MRSSPSVVPEFVRQVRRAVADLPDRCDPAQAAQELLDVVLSRVPGANGGALLLMHPQTGLFATGAVTGLPAPSCHPFFNVELSSSEDSLRRMAATMAPARALRRHYGASALQSEVLEPFGFNDELRAVCTDGGLAWGGISLWRRAGEFTVADEALLDAVSGIIGAALRDTVLSALSVLSDGPAGRSVRGLLLVEERRVVESALEHGVLGQELVDAGFEQYRHVDHLLALAAADARFSTVIRSAAGDWIAVHGTELSDGRQAILLNSAAPADLLGTRVAGAGLSVREIEVTRLLCRGLSDAEIAAELFLSLHTVHDHVRSVRRKLGAKSRAAVAAQVFRDAYLDQFLSTAAVKHSGT